MTLKELKRVAVLGRMVKGEVGGREAAEVLGVSRRTVQRLRARLERGGPQALAHGNRGRPSPRRRPAELVRRVVELFRKRYSKCNDVHLTEKLREVEGVAVSRSWVRRVLRSAGLGPKRRRRPPQHRIRRERRPLEGWMLQLDASPHDWLGQGTKWSLHGAIDDATDRVVGLYFRPTEDAVGYFTVLGQVAHRYGLPLSVYVDAFFTHKDRPDSLSAQLRGERELTQLERALNELGIELIRAYSAQAKGRIERLWGTLQDRLVVELKLARIRTLDQANAFLQGFLEDFNRRFARTAPQAGSAYRTVPRGLRVERVLAFAYEGTVSVDNVVTLGERSVAIAPTPYRRSWARAPVRIHELCDGSLHILHARTGLLLAIDAPPAKPVPVRARSRRRAAPAARLLTPRIRA